MAAAKASYLVRRVNDKWAVQHDGTVEGDYETKEATFEAIVGAASNTIKSGIAVQIEIPGSEADEPALGAR